MRSNHIDSPFFRKIIVLSLILAFIPTLVSAQNKSIKDDVGNVFNLTAAPQRLISLAPNITEILFCLGLGEKIIGVTRYCDYPIAALQKEKIGGLLDPDIEKIKALNPDLIIAFRGNPLNTLKKLQVLHLPVFILDIGNDLESVLKIIEKIGRITHSDREAAALLKTLSDKYQKVEEALAGVIDKPRVFLNLHSLGLWTCGKESYLNDLFLKAKSLNIAGRIAKKWLEYKKEQLIKDNPDVIIILAKTEDDFVAAQNLFRRQSGLREIRAVKTGRIYFLDENITSRFGPRLYDALAELARLLHPERF
jgi:iron complex transport system substrate-binding protein